MQYHVVMAENIEDLTTMIENYLEAGWELQGGVAVVLSKENQNESFEKTPVKMLKFNLFQAVIKK
jgi:hypothetical protein